MMFKIRLCIVNGGRAEVRPGAAEALRDRHTKAKGKP